MKWVMWGVACSFGARFFGGYVKEGQTFITRKDASKSGYSNRQLGVKRALLKQCLKLKGVTFTSGDYRHVYIQENDIVYCDPPYKDTADYGSDFNHDDFWQWVRCVSQYAEVYVSEYNAPSDMLCIYEHRVKTGMSKDNNDIRTEKLFTYL